MRFVLKEQKPRLLYTVYVYLNLDRAGIYLLGFVELVEMTVFPEIFDCKSGDIHETYRLCASELASYRYILIVCSLKKRILKFHIVYRGKKCRMTAMIGPVCVYHLYFRDCRVTVFVFKVRLTECYVVLVHRKAIVSDKFFKTVRVKACKSVKRFYGRRDIVVYLKRLGLFKRSLASLDGVYYIFLYFSNIVIGNIAVKRINLGRAYKRTLTLRDYLNTLSRGICSLVELTGQIFNSEYKCAVKICLGRRNIKLRLGEYRLYRIIKELLGNILRIVAV